MKYRKLPVVIEAFKFDGDLMNTHGQYYVPDWAAQAFVNGELFYANENALQAPDELFVKSLEGSMHVSLGDYVIQGVNGELYPCKPDIFEKTYELAE